MLNQIENLRLKSLKSINLILLLIFIAGLLSACMMSTRPVARSPLEMQSIQTRVFDAPKREVFNATITTLQDVGFLVKTAEYNSGFITANYNFTLRDYSYRSIDPSVTVIPLDENRSQVRINLIRELILRDVKERCIARSGNGSWNISLLSLSVESNDPVPVDDDDCPEVEKYVEYRLETVQETDPALYEGLYQRIQQNLFSEGTLTV